MRKKTIIFLPGFMCDERLFEAQISACQRAGYDAIFGDISNASTIEGLARNILRSAPDRFALAGLSMGGIVALEIIKQAKERVTHLALLNTTPYSDKIQAQRKKQIVRVSEGELGLVMREELKPNYLASCNRTPERLALLTDMGEHLGKYSFTRQSLALMNREDIAYLLPEIKCPTLVLTGRDDTVCTPQIHMEMAAVIPSATLMILPQCGHLSSIEKPNNVSAALLNLLKYGDENYQRPKPNLRLIAQSEYI